MPTNDELREVAARLRVLDYSDLKESLICAYLDALGIEGYADWVGIAHRLADLIEPSGGFDIDAVYQFCFDCLEGCDEPEWSLYNTVMSAICAYKKGEGGYNICSPFWHKGCPVLEPACDRDELLKIADEIEDADVDGCIDWADRIRNACGE